MHWLHIRNRIPAWMSDPSEIAGFVVSELGLTSPPVKMASVLRSMGVELLVAPEGVSGAAEFTLDPPSARIWVNREESRVRRNFTLAHELGHLLLHDGGLRYRDLRGSGSASTKVEREANRFAAAFIMPSELVSRYLITLNQNTAALATLFQVSEPAMLIRLREIGAL